MFSRGIVGVGLAIYGRGISLDLDMVAGLICTILGQTRSQVGVEDNLSKFEGMEVERGSEKKRRWA